MIFDLTEKRKQFVTEKRKQFDAHRAELDVAYDKLPKAFQARIDRLRASGPDWRVLYEAYESFCCVEAVKIAEHCKTADAVRAFTNDRDAQKGVVSVEHSGNTFNTAVRLAWLYLKEPDVWKDQPHYALLWEHGALAGLVGCEEYGCHKAPL